MKETGDLIATFGTKTNTSLGLPHWLAVGSGGKSIYAADIQSPYRVVKIVLGIYVFVFSPIRNFRF